MAWVLLKNSGAVKLLEKLAALQVKLTELLIRQKMNSAQMKLNMLRAGKNDRPKSTES